jgi:hypothetical protein
VRELVIVIADLYLTDAPDAAAPEVAAAFDAVPGIEAVTRFGTRTPLTRGWRDWLASSLGHPELSGAALACTAAAVLPVPPPPVLTSWIATPLSLHAGAASVHLDHRGILRLARAEQDALAADFARTFGSSGHALLPLPSGAFMLCTSAIGPRAMREPARWAGSELAASLPDGSAAAPLRRLMAETEMWLHGQPVNTSRAQRGQMPVTTLWPWGAEGRIVHPAPGSLRVEASAFGRDPWLEGLWHLGGSACRALPADTAGLLAGADTARIVVVTEGGSELQQAVEGTVASAVATLDERFVSPALRALRRGELARVTLILNDVRFAVARNSLRRLWRHTRRGLEGFL